MQRVLAFDAGRLHKAQARRRGVRLRGMPYVRFQVVSVGALGAGNDYDTPFGSWYASGVPSMTQKELERFREHRARLQRRGVRWGRPSIVTAALRDAMRKLRVEGLSLRAVASRTGVSVATACRALKQHLASQHPRHETRK